MLILDELRAANWMRSKDGAKNRNRPDPVSPLAKSNKRKIGGTDIPQDQVREWLRQIGPAERTNGDHTQEVTG